MSSSVHFKFKSWKEPQRIAFDGTGITIFELKREIISHSGLGDGTDFDLALYPQDSNEEYKDDTEIIPRSSMVICRRIPASRPGYGKAARYVSGKAPTTAKNSYRMEQQRVKPADAKGANGTKALEDMDKAQTEEEKIAAMFRAGGDAWEQQQQQMANAKPVYRPGNKGKPVNIPDHDPPPGYVCYRCQEKGHWIQACPTNDDPNFEKRPRIKRTTGIPRTFLQKVDKPAALKNDGLTDDRKQTSVMMNAEGEYVIVKTDDRSWEKFQEKAKASAAQQEAASASLKELEDRGLLCPIDKRLFDNPMKTDCCSTTYCNDCIENALVNSDLVCPNCGSEGVLIDNLTSDDEMTKRIQQYDEEKAAAQKAKERSKSPQSDTTLNNSADGEDNKGNNHKANDSHTKAGANADSESAAGKPASQTSTPRSSASTPALSENGKKRPAEEELKNDRVPSAPAAMRKQQEQQKAQAKQTAPSGFENFVEQMNALAPAPNFPNGNANMFPFPGMAGMGFSNQAGMGMGMGMGMSMPPMMNMPNGMMNPMMMNPQQQQQPGMYGMNGAGFQGQFGGFNGMPNGYGPQHQQHQHPQQQQNWNQGWGMNGMPQQHQQPPQQGWQNGGMRGNGFPNQQRSGFGGGPPVSAGGGGGAEQFQEDDSDAYFRKPVNPHRHTNRNRRIRPSDYTEL